jgi:hypothetical protein
MGIVYLLAGINIVSKTRLHHIENGHKSTAALDFGWASCSAPFCVLRKFFCSAIFLQGFYKVSTSCK